jgi:hypothetical protein
MGRAGEPVAVITEIRMGRGEVRVKTAGEEIWRRALPLHALQPGDQVSVTEDGLARLVFSGGRGTQAVTEGNSPFTVQAPAGPLVAERLRAVMDGILQYLSGKRKDLTYLPLVTRVLPEPGRILLVSPRETRLFPGPIAFEWAGPDRLRYTLRVLGPQGPVWAQAGLRRQPLAYPATAPALSAGVPYAWELEASGHPAQRAPFEILPPAEAARIRAALALLDPAALAGYSRATLRLMRAGLLVQEGLHHDARQELLAGIRTDPNEPTLHLLLGQVYEQVGLRGLSEDAFREVQALTARRP